MDQMVGAPAAAASGPVIVLAGRRSGSTLLRFILDSHPSLACPAETNVAELCEGMSRLWRQLDRSSTTLSPEAATSIRSSIDAMFAGYLESTGKRRWCDKTLDSAASSWELAQLYPDARFICLYRHCTDVIDSSLEQFPRGVDDPALSPFMLRHPGNHVAGLAQYWLQSTRAILNFERAHSERCHRVYYEELVSRPEQTVAEMFTWLGEVTVPGITRTTFDDDHGLPGPGDDKIWATSRISRASVGRGTRIPVGKIPPRLRRQASTVLRNLGYPGLTSPYRRSSDSSADIETDTDREADEAAKAEIDATLTDRLSRRLADLTTVPPAWARVLGRKTIKVSVLPTDSSAASHWLISIDPPQVTSRPVEPESGAAWTVLAEPSALLAVLRGELNLMSALRRRAIRLTDIAPRVTPDEPPGPTPPQPPMPLPAPHVRRQILIYLFGANDIPDADTAPDDATDEPQATDRGNADQAGLAGT